MVIALIYIIPSLPLDMAFMFVQIVFVDIQVLVPLTYLLPPAIVDKVDIGTFVTAPIRNSHGLAIVISKHEHIDTTAKFAIKPIEEALPPLPPLSHKIMKLFSLVSFFYSCPIKNVIDTAISHSITPRSLQSVISFEQQECGKAALSEEEQQTLESIIQCKTSQYFSLKHWKDVNQLIENNVLQIHIPKHISCLHPSLFVRYILKHIDAKEAAMLDKIYQDISNAIFQKYLISGISISDKITYYTSMIQHAIALNKSVMIILPDINTCSMSMIRMIQSNIDIPIVVWHSRLSKLQKAHTWQFILNSNIKVIIGTKNAIFLPISELGLVIIDNEHDRHLKQYNKTPLFHVRDIAHFRCQIEPCPVVMTSNTPSLDSLYKAYKNNITHYAYDFHAIDKVYSIIIDKNMYKSQMLTPPLLTHINNSLKNGEQVVLIFNKRGYKRSLLCKHHQQITCNKCGMYVSIHHNNHDIYLKCHSCNTKTDWTSKCSQCKDTLSGKGIGIQFIYEQAHIWFPEKHIDRLDSDLEHSTIQHQLNKIKTGHTDIIICTHDMVSKIDATRVTTWGILDADSYLYVPDFFAEEKTFYPILNVIAKAAETPLQSKVIIQTNHPTADSVVLACNKELSTFFHNQLQARIIHSLPPINSLLKCFISCRSPKEISHLYDMREWLIQQTKEGPYISDINMEGDTDANLKNTKASFFVKTNDIKSILTHIAQYKKNIDLNQVVLYIDPSPVTFL